LKSAETPKATAVDVQKDALTVHYQVCTCAEEAALYYGSIDMWGLACHNCPYIRFSSLTFSKADRVAFSFNPAEFQRLQNGEWVSPKETERGA
jgi:hypothetical protein